MKRRYLVVNADDCGRTEAITRGILRAHRDGVVTSTSLMVRWPAAEVAIHMLRSSGLGIGLHIDLGEWVFDSGSWRAEYEVVDTDDRSAVEVEVRYQLRRFLDLVGGPPTHLDSHQNVHRTERVRTVVRRLAAELSVACRYETPGITYVGDFYGQTGTGDPLPENVTVDHFVEVISRLPAGISELGCHPSDDVENELSYGPERSQELETLCASRVRAVLEEQEVELIDFSRVAEILDLRTPP